MLILLGQKETSRTKSFFPLAVSAGHLVTVTMTLTGRLLRMKLFAIANLPSALCIPSWSEPLGKHLL